MSIFKNLGKSLLVAGIFMMLAVPVMAKNHQGGTGDGIPDCTCCDEGLTSNNPECPCYVLPSSF